MKDIPIIFSAAMVRALLDGRKTMTRRLAWNMDADKRVQWKPSPWQKVKPGDRLWVRENWQLHSKASDVGTVVYMASVNQGWSEAHEQIPVALLPGNIQPKPFQSGHRPSIHMPRVFSRITLVVQAVKVERLQDISPPDAIAEGIAPTATSQTIDCETPNPVDAFRDLWNSLHGADAWEANPEVVALTFRLFRQNIDQVEDAA